MTLAKDIASHLLKIQAVTLSQKNHSLGHQVSSHRFIRTTV